LGSEQKFCEVFALTPAVPADTAPRFEPAAPFQELPEIPSFRTFELSGTVEKRTGTSRVRATGKLREGNCQEAAIPCGSQSRFHRLVGSNDP
jgi:hypothetical protein